MCVRVCVCACDGGTGRVVGGGGGARGGSEFPHPFDGDALALSIVSLPPPHSRFLSPSLPLLSLSPSSPPLSPINSDAHQTWSLKSSTSLASKPAALQTAVNALANSPHRPPRAPSSSVGTSLCLGKRRDSGFRHPEQLQSSTRPQPRERSSAVGAAAPSTHSFVLRSFFSLYSFPRLPVIVLLLLLPLPLPLPLSGSEARRTSHLSHLGESIHSKKSRLNHDRSPSSNARVSVSRLRPPPLVAPSPPPPPPRLLSLSSASLFFSFSFSSSSRTACFDSLRSLSIGVTALAAAREAGDRCCGGFFCARVRGGGRRRGQRTREREEKEGEEGARRASVFSSSLFFYLGRERQAVAEVLRYLVDTSMSCCLLLILSHGLLLFELEGQGESGVGIGVHFCEFFEQMVSPLTLFSLRVLSNSLPSHGLHDPVPARLPDGAGRPYRRRMDGRRDAARR